VSAINTSPNEPDFMTSRPSNASVVPRLMVVTGGTMVLIGAWLLGSGSQSTLGAALVVAGALDALVALVLARRG
jgi:hypothetical protein